jgi:hypothetical protein
LLSIAPSSGHHDFRVGAIPRTRPKLGKILTVFAVSTAKPYFGPHKIRREHELNPQPRKSCWIWYLLLVLIGPLRLIYIPNELFVHGNAAATANNIAAHEWLFRFGIVGDLVGAVILVLLALAFYRLFKGVDHYLAVLVVILRRCNAIAPLLR